MNGIHVMDSWIRVWCDICKEWHWELKKEKNDNE